MKLTLRTLRCQKKALVTLLVTLQCVLLLVIFGWVPGYPRAAQQTPRVRTTREGSGGGTDTNGENVGNHGAAGSVPSASVAVVGVRDGAVAAQKKLNSSSHNNVIIRNDRRQLNIRLNTNTTSDAQTPSTVTTAQTVTTSTKTTAVSAVAANSHRHRNKTIVVVSRRPSQPSRRKNHGSSTKKVNPKDSLHDNNRKPNNIRISGNSTSSWASSSNVSHAYWLSLMRTYLAKNGGQFPVATNLLEWFPLQPSFQGSMTFRLRDTAADIELDSKRVSPKHQDGGSQTRTKCWPEGTDTRRPRDNATSSRCPCKPSWHGRWCSVPDSVAYSSGGSFLSAMTLRQRPRKIIMTVAFNMEFDLLEARLHELWDSVDVFVLYESNYTLFGEPKPLRLLEAMLSRDGFLSEFRSKLYYLFLGVFPKQAASVDGWYAEEHERSFIGRDSMRHVLGAQPDDLFIYTDADEIPSRQTLEFLRVHDGYPEPFGFSLRWSVYGFFWCQNSPTVVTAGCSVRMFRYLYANDAQRLRTRPTSGLDGDVMRRFLQLYGSDVTVHTWAVGDGGSGGSSSHAGWHCSWCLSPELIRVKLISAINADFPRWGNFPEKLDLSYIQSLVARGQWFDDSTTMDGLVTRDTDDYFAPEYILKNWDRYKYILDINVHR